MNMKVEAIAHGVFGGVVFFGLLDCEEDHDKPEAGGQDAGDENRDRSQ